MYMYKAYVIMLHVYIQLKGSEVCSHRYSIKHSFPSLLNRVCAESESIKSECRGCIGLNDYLCQIRFIKKNH